MNVLENIPYEKEKPGKRKMVENEHLLVMQIALEPGQAVPEHRANSNVNLLVVEGSLDIALDGISQSAVKGSLIQVNHLANMSIKNNADVNASLVVIKTPHPDKMHSES